MSLYKYFWNQVTPIKIPGTQFTFTGHSKAAKNTSFYIPEMKIMLDCGIEHDYIPEHIFITHGHSDHSRDITNTIAQLSNFKNRHQQKKVDIYAPTEIIEYIRNYIDAFFVMSKNNPRHRAHFKYNLIPVEANTRIPVIIRNTKYVIEIIKCFHTVPCVGYGFIEIRKRLKKEYHGLSQSELISLKKEGTDIQEEYEYHMFCYIGDTNENVFINDETCEIIKKYSVIINECSFINADQISQAINKKHIYIESIHEYITSNPDKTFILYHFSARYDDQDIIDFFIKKNYPNVIPWVSLVNNIDNSLIPWKHYLP